MTRLSPIESLPVEILEPIFLTCLNISLPRASLCLGTKLSSPTIKLKSLLKVFLSDEDGITEHYAEIQKALWMCRVDRTVAEIGFLQSNILECRWLTWEFLQLYMETFITKAIMRGLGSQDLPWEDLQPVRETVVREYVHNVLYSNVNLGIDQGRLDSYQFTTKAELDDYYRILEERAKTGAEQSQGGSASSLPEKSKDDHAAQSDVSDANDLDVGYHRIQIRGDEWDEHNNLITIQDTIITSSFVPRCWTLDQPHGKVAVGITPRTGVLVIGSRQGGKENGDYPKDQSVRWRSLSISRDIEIPDKLRRGPWTDAKLNFLEAILAEEPRLNYEENYELADIGLMEAVLEDNYRAVDLIASESIDVQHKHFNGKEGVYVEPNFNDAKFDFDNCDETGCPSLKYCYDRCTLDVTPKTEHVRAAVINRGCKLKIVRRLLFALKPETRIELIDIQDPSISSWIQDRKRTGDDKGQWLEYQLKKRKNVWETWYSNFSF